MALGISWNHQSHQDAYLLELPLLWGTVAHPTYLPEKGILALVGNARIAQREVPVGQVNLVKKGTRLIPGPVPQAITPS